MEKQDDISNKTTFILIFSALAIIVFIYWQDNLARQPKSDLEKIKNWRQLELSGFQTGPSSAPVKIIEFFDYQCPYCKQAQASIQKTKNKYSNQVSIAYEHFPLNSHQYAFRAAVSVECARRQGFFEPFHDLLFAYQDRLSKVSYMTLSSKINIPDSVAFNRCIRNKETVKIVNSGRNLAKQLNISSIPTFIINGRLVSGALSQQRLEDLVKKAMSESKN